MSPTEQSALMARIAAGDQEALRSLYALYRPRLWGYLWLLLDRDAGWVEEVAQDVFLAVWSGAASYRGEAAVATWLFRIAHHLAANARRARARRIQGQPFALLDEDAPEGALACDSHEERIVERLTLTDALNSLSLKHREALDLAFTQGFTVDEIARILAIPPGTVKSRLSYARRALQAQLREAPYTTRQEERNDA